MLEQFCKRCDESLDYVVDFYRWLGTREVITECTAVVTPDTITVSRLAFTEKKAVVWLMGGVDQEVYLIEVTITTDKGRRKTFEFQVRTVGEPGGFPSVSIADTSVVTGKLELLT